LEDALMSDYQREIVYEDESVQVVKITLPPGAETPIHDHGVSIGVVHILSGELSERYYRRQTRDWSLWHLYKAGETLRESGGHIHKVKNFGIMPLTMLNIYYPPLHMNIFEPTIFDYPGDD
jgi:cysteine dioxygenase